MYFLPGDPSSPDETMTFVPFFLLAPLILLGDLLGVPVGVTVLDLVPLSGVRDLDLVLVGIFPVM